MHGSWTVETVVLVQDGALHEVLLSTDLQSKLGFALMAREDTRPEKTTPRRTWPTGVCLQGELTSLFGALQGDPLKTRVIVAQPFGLMEEDSEKHPAENRQTKSRRSLAYIQSWTLLKEDHKSCVEWYVS